MILLIDSENLLHRCHHVAKNAPLINSKGEDTSCIFKFLRSLKALASQFRPTATYATWGIKVVDETNVNFRVTLTEGTYKAGRNHDEKDDIYVNEKKLVPVLDSLGIRNFFPKALEADDIVAWLTVKLKDNELCTIVSCDRDFLQLVQPNVQVYSPSKCQLYTIKNFEKLIGIKPNEYLTYKAITGDVADNLRHPCLMGLGPKTAIKIIHSEKTLSLEQAQAVKEMERLMDLKQGLIEHPKDVVFLEEQFETKRTQQPNFDAFVDFCKEKEFKSILKSIDEWKSVFTKNRLLDLISSLNINS